ncbi:MAG: hypothetical protein R3D30_00110 [Hyphomicrobiales bacterium]
MKRLSHLLCCCAVAVLAAGATASYVQAQSASGRALLIYKEGVTPEQENQDRAACNEWAIQQSGFDPSAIYTAQMAGVNTRTIFDVVGKLDVAAGGTDPRWGSGAFGGATTSADRRRLAELYDAYLRAGALCLEGRGYVVAR